MKYLPFENITFHSKLPVNEIIELLKQHVEPEKFFRFRGFYSPKPKKPYEGYVHGRTFNIRRIIRYRNSFLPRITGMIEPVANGTKVHVKMQLHALVVVFVWVWVSGVFIALLATLFAAISSKELNIFFLIPLAMLVFMYFLTTLAFKHESNRSIRDLQTILNARISENK